MVAEPRRDPGSRMPRGKRDGRGRATYWGDSVFKSTFGGRCRRCGEKIEPGDYVQKGKSGGMQHPRCAQGEKDIHQRGASR